RDLLRAADRENDPVSREIADERQNDPDQKRDHEAEWTPTSARHLAHAVTEGEKKQGHEGDQHRRSPLVGSNQLEHGIEVRMWTGRAAMSSDPPARPGLRTSPEPASALPPS